jgi:hypothetical protein
MATSPASRSSASNESKYWDRRSPTEYHTDPRCQVGRWIPAEAIYRSDTHAGRRCATCADGGTDIGGGTLLFAI